VDPGNLSWPCHKEAVEEGGALISRVGGGRSRSSRFPIEEMLKGKEKTSMTLRRENTSSHIREKDRKGRTTKRSLKWHENSFIGKKRLQGKGGSTKRRGEKELYPGGGERGGGGVGGAMRERKGCPKKARIDTWDKGKGTK